jgi:hypothetical protein
MTDDANPAALRELQDELFRQKVLRARRMTPSERLDEAFQLSQAMLEEMHSGAMQQCGFTDPTDGWDEVARRLARQRSLQDHNLYQPVASD